VISIKKLKKNWSFSLRKKRLESH